MRNLILFATQFAIVLSETDVEQLGYDVTKEDFLTYFEIDEATHVNKEDFSPMDNSFFMTPQEEKEVHDKFMVKKAKSKGVAKAQDEAKLAKANEKAETAEKAKKTKAKAEPKAPKAPKEKVVKEKVIGVIGTIQQILTDTKEPVSQEQIYAQLKTKFPEKGETMKKTVYCQLSGKEQPLRMEKEKGVKIEVTTKEETINEKVVQTKLYRIIPA